MAQVPDALIATDAKTRKKILGCKKEKCLEIEYFYSLISRDAKTIESIQKAIDMGYDEFSKELGACFILSSIYHYEDNEQKAQYYAKLGCENKEYESCALLGGTHYEKKEYKEAKKHFESVCNKASRFTKGFTCAYLGSYYAMGQGVRQDIKKAYSLFKLSCESVATIGCVSMASVYEVG